MENGKWNKNLKSIKKEKGGGGEGEWMEESWKQGWEKE